MPTTTQYTIRPALSQDRDAIVSLLKAVQGLAQQKGIQALYLITTTAAPFFEKRGFAKVDRSAVPVAIQRTTQFSALCPSSATVMHRNIP